MVIHKSINGFTLLELLIALTLMAFVSAYTAQSIRSTVSGSKRIQSDIDVLTELRSAVALIKADVSRAYNNRDLYNAVYNEAQREHIKRWNEAKSNPAGSGTPPAGDADGSGGQPSTPPQTPPPLTGQGAIDNRPAPEYKPRLDQTLTVFIGEKDRLDFTSLNGNSVRKGAYTSELVEIGYSLKKCKRRSRDQKDTECLWRRLSYHLDGDVLQGGQESVLIEDVTKFEFKYLRKLTEDEVEWRETWPLDDVNTQNLLPLAVELLIEVTKPTDKSGENFKTKRTTAYIPIDFENNDNIKSIIQMNAQGNPLEPQTQDLNGAGSDNLTNPPPNEDGF